MVSGLALFYGLFNNLALYIVLVAVYGFLNARFPHVPGTAGMRRQVVFGLVFGFFVIGFMQVKIPVFEGVLVDQRNSVVILSGAFGGPLSAALTASVAAAYRASLGGQGVAGGVFGICLSAVAGVFIHHRKARIDTLWKGALTAIGAAVFILPGFLPIGSLHAGWQLMKAMALPYGSAISIGLCVSGLLMANEERRRQVQIQLVESELKFRSLFENLIDVSYRVDAGGRVTVISPSCERVFGFRPEELVGKEIRALYQDPSFRAELLARVRDDGEVKNFPVPMKKKDGTPIVVSVNSRRILGTEGEFLGLEGVLRDISALKRAEDELRSSLAEKEALLGELFHRTNNNMQLITSFLQLQASAIDHPKAAELAFGVGSRISAMALVYEKLSRTRSLSRIRVRDYVADLLPLIARACGSPEGKVSIELELEDLDFVLDTAIPFGLVINEIATNSFLHAFPGDRKGKLTVSVRRLGPGLVSMTVSDDGVGFPPAFDPYAASTLGIRTTVSLVRMQMHGSIDIIADGGVSYRITFSDKLYSERI